jgi:hypothetical protein
MLQFSSGGLHCEPPSWFSPKSARFDDPAPFLMQQGPTRGPALKAFVCARTYTALEYLPYRWDHLIEKEWLRFYELEHAGIENVDRLFLRTFSKAPLCQMSQLAQ